MRRSEFFAPLLSHFNRVLADKRLYNIRIDDAACSQIEHARRGVGGAGKNAALQDWGFPDLVDQDGTTNGRPMRRPMFGGIARGRHVRGKRGSTNHRAFVRFGIAIALVSALAGCSSAPSDDYSVVASAYPNRPLLGLLTESREPPAHPAPSPASAGAAAAPGANQAASVAAQNSPATPTPTPSVAPDPANSTATSNSSEDSGHSAASAYPNVPVIDILFGSSKRPAP